MESLIPKENHEIDYLFDDLTSISTKKLKEVLGVFRAQATKILKYVYNYNGLKGKEKIFESISKIESELLGRKEMIEDNKNHYYLNDMEKDLGIKHNEDDE
jgi:hypothetical protein